jgi:hypothetical protein
MMTITSAPGDLVVATSDGVRVRFTGIELTTHLPGHLGALPGERGMKIGLEGIRSDETRRRDQSFDDARVQWVEQRRAQGAEGAGDMPTMPGVLALEPITVNISDDSGTEYRCVAGQIAGDGTEWAASWTYLPEPPEHVRSLNLEFALNGEPTGKNCQIRVD